MRPVLNVRSLAFVVGLMLISPATAQDTGAAGFTAYHPPVTTTLVDPQSDGHRVGDIRVFSFAVTDEAGTGIGRLDGTLVTTAIDTPNAGDEIRVSELVFNFGNGDVIIIGGSGPYSAQAATLDTDIALVRPIKGTSGRFAGMTGWCESFHLADGSWRHEFHFTNGAGQ